MHFTPYLIRDISHSPLGRSVPNYTVRYRIQLLFFSSFFFTHASPASGCLASLFYASFFEPPPLTSSPFLPNVRKLVSPRRSAVSVLKSQIHLLLTAHYDIVPSPEKNEPYTSSFVSSVLRL